jgi:hypothetical protein
MTRLRFTHPPHFLPFPAIVLALAWLAGAFSAAAQDTSAFTYSGRLLDAGNPAHGLYDLEFTLHSSETNDAPVGNPSTVLRPAVSISNGLFTTAVDFGPDAFNGEPRWLEVRVGPSGAANLGPRPREVLGPRQQVRSVPQATYTQRARTAVSADMATTATKAQTAVIAETATNAVNATKAQTAVTADTATNAVVAQRARSLDAGTYSNAMTFSGRVTFNPDPNVAPGLAAASPPSPAPFDVVHSTKVENLNADLLDGLDSAAFALLNSSPVFTGDLVGARLRVGSGHTLTGAGATIAGGAGNIASGGFAAVLGGNVNTASGSQATVGGGGINTASGTGATVVGGTLNTASGNFALAAGRRAKANHTGAFVWADSTDADFASTANDQFLIRASGGVGIGVNNPDTELVVNGKIKAHNGLFAPPANGINGGLGNRLILWPGTASFAPYSLGIDAGTMWFGVPDIPAHAFKWYFGTTERMRLNSSGNVGIGVSNPTAALHVKYASPFDSPQLELEDPSDFGFARVRMQTGTRRFWDIAVGTGSDETNSLRFYNDGNGDVMTVTTNGHLSVCALTIRGGCDLAEPFEMSSKDIPKGAVVIIDEDHPGQLKLSERAYDTRVAGIVSGAGGVSPGILLTQEGVLDTGQNVALTGRVYAQADASSGPIQPGDLLTTSDTPGHAMKVTDHTRSQGAILGKAMTPLGEGKGVVLVLVTLQ